MKDVTITAPSVVEAHLYDYIAFIASSFNDFVSFSLIVVHRAELVLGFN